MKTWRERIAEARERGWFTEQDRLDAGRWCSCAVGEQWAQMPAVIVYTNVDRSDPAWRNGGPSKYDDLLDWGSDFPQAVCGNDYDRADHLLDLIEDRALQLKREQSA